MKFMKMYLFHEISLDFNGHTRRYENSADALSIPRYKKEPFRECRVCRESVGSVVKKTTFPKYMKGLIICEFWILPTLPALPKIHPTLPALPTLPTLSSFLFLFFSLLNQEIIDIIYNI